MQYKQYYEMDDDDRSHCYELTLEQLTTVNSAFVFLDFEEYELTFLDVFKSVDDDEMNDILEGLRTAKTDKELNAVDKKAIDLFHAAAESVVSEIIYGK